MFKSLKNDKKNTSTDYDNGLLNEAFDWSLQDEVLAPPPDVGEILLPEQNTGSCSDAFFSFIHKNHLSEAQEFRRKGYNPRVPELDTALLNRLRETVQATRDQGGVGLLPDIPPCTRAWLVEQFHQLELHVNLLSAGTFQCWINNALTVERPIAEKIQNRRAAQSLAWGLDETLALLFRAAYALSTFEQLVNPASLHRAAQAALLDEFVGEFSLSDGQARGAFLDRMMTEAPWIGLVNARAEMAERDSMIALQQEVVALCDGAKKAATLARELRGDGQVFFHDIAAFTERLSQELKSRMKKYLQVSPTSDVTAEAGDAVPGATGQEKPEETNWLASAAGAYSKKLKHWAGNLSLMKDTQMAVLVKTSMGRAQRFVSDDVPSEQRAEEAAIRSVLWLWQQPAFELLRVSSALLFKVTELKKISQAFAVGTDSADAGTAAQSGEGTAELEARWIREKAEQMTPGVQRKRKVEVLRQLLAGDIATAQEIVARLGETKEGTDVLLSRQLASVARMVREPFAGDMTRAFRNGLPVLAEELAGTIGTLKKAVAAAGAPSPDFSLAQQKAERAQIKATRIISRLSAGASSMTGRSLDELSAGSRLAIHWATLALKHGYADLPVMAPADVLALMKTHGLLQGTLSSGDPEGCLAATRLATGLEHARYDRLVLPMSPKEYIAQEKDMMEFIVKWAQDQVTQRASGLAVSVALEGAMFVLSVGVLTLPRVGWKLLKGAIKIPLKIHSVNKHIMVSQDRDYDAVLSILDKKLKQLGFKIAMTPVPKIAKLGSGIAVTGGAFAYNRVQEGRENTVTWVYERVVEGKKTQKLKMYSARNMAVNAGIDTGLCLPKVTGRIVSQRAGGIRRVSANGVEYHNLDNKRGGKVSLTEGERGMLSSRGKRQIERTERECSESEILHRTKRRVPDGLENQDKRLGVSKYSYYNQILSVLLNDISRDESLPKECRDNAIRAIYGEKLLYHFALGLFFMPNKSGSKTGIIINLNNALRPYFCVGEKKLAPYSYDMDNPYPSPSKKRDYAKNFNAKNIKPMGVSEISRELVEYNAPKEIGGNHSWLSMQCYKDLSPEIQEETYNYALISRLKAISGDKTTPENLRKKAHDALIGIPTLVTVDIFGIRLYNVFFIPDSPGGKTGLIVNLNDGEPLGVYVKKKSDIPSHFYDNIIGEYFREYKKNVMTRVNRPSESDLWLSMSFGRKKAINNLKNGSWNISTDFNDTHPTEIDAITLSKQMASDYSERFKNEQDFTHNRFIIESGIMGSQIPKPDVSARPVNYKMPIKFASLTASEYLRSFSQPFTLLSGQFQQIASYIEGESVKEANENIGKAEYVGQWLDVTIGAISTYTFKGMILNIAQTGSRVLADVNEGKIPDPFDVAALVFAGARGVGIEARIGKFSKIGGKSFNVLLQVSEKIIDLTELTLSIGKAIKSKETLDIYTALLSAGMNASDAHSIYNVILSHIGKSGGEALVDAPKIQLPTDISVSSKITQQDSNAINSDENHSVVYKKEVDHDRGEGAVKADVGRATAFDSTRLSKTKSRATRIYQFKISKRVIRGRLKEGVFEISRDHGVTWVLGSKLQHFHFALQNAGGKPSRLQNTPISLDITTPPESSSGLSSVLRIKKNPRNHLKFMREKAPNVESMPFHFFGKPMLGKVQNGVFKFSKDGGRHWRKGGWVKEGVWREMNEKNIKSHHQEERFNKALQYGANSNSFHRKREPIINMSQFKSLSSGEARIIEDVKVILLQQTPVGFYTSNPEENNVIAAIQAKSILNKNGYEDVSIVELGIWNGDDNDKTPSNHYIVTAKKDGVEFVVDLTASRFEKYLFFGPVVDTRNNWINRWQRGVKNSPNLLVKTVPITGEVSTSPFSSFSPYIDAWKTVPDGEVIQSPAWYNNTNSVIGSERPGGNNQNEYDAPSTSTGISRGRPIKPKDKPPSSTNRAEMDHGKPEPQIKLTAKYWLPETADNTMPRFEIIKEKYKGKSKSIDSDNSPDRTLAQVTKEFGKKTIGDIKTAAQGHDGSEPLVLYRRMSPEEAEKIKYWSANKKGQLERDIESGNAIDEESIIHVTGHLGDYEQAHGYNGVLMKFTLKPGCENVLFSPRILAIQNPVDIKKGKQKIRKQNDVMQNIAMKHYPDTHAISSGSEGTKAGYIGIKNEKRGDFSFAIGDSKATQAVFTLFVAEVAEVAEVGASLDKSASMTGKATKNMGPESEAGPSHSERVSVQQNRDTDFDSDQLITKRGTPYKVHNHGDWKLWQLDQAKVIPGEILLSAHGFSTDNVVPPPQNTTLYFYIENGKALPDSGLSSRKRHPLVRVSNGKTEVPDGSGGWRDALSHERKNLTGTDKPGYYKEMNLNFFENDNPEGVLDIWHLEDGQSSDSASRPGIVTLNEFSGTKELSDIASHVSQMSPGQTDIHVLACRETRWTALRNSVAGNRQGTRQPPVLPNRLSNIISQDSARNYTNSRPVTDDMGRAIINGAQQLPDNVKAGGIIGGMLAALAVVGYAGYKTSTRAEYLSAFESLTQNSYYLMRNFGSFDSEVMDNMQESFFGKKDMLTQDDIRDVYKYFLDILLYAQGDDIQDLYSGKISENLSKINQPDVFRRVSLRQINLFVMFMAQKESDPEKFNAEYDEIQKG